jgi:dihydroorotase
MRFDLLIKGGELVDPGAGLAGELDVAVTGGRVAAVDRAIPADSAARVIDAAGQYVTPGLVDLHTHVYDGATFWGIDPDPVAWRSGTTTWVDAGSAGAYTLAGLLDGVAARARARVLALVHISAVGLVAETGESTDLGRCDPDLCARVAGAHGDRVVGVKVRIDRQAVGEHGLEPLRRALDAAARCGRPVMTHIGRTPPDIDDVLGLLRPGDVVTHCATGQSMRLVDGDGRPRPAVLRARDAGVVLDVGHGAGSFSFEVAEALLAGGIAPDVISTDAHQRSVLGPMFDLPTCLSKYLCLGMSLPEVVRAATARPAEVVGRYPEIGSLRPGARADVALFRLDRGRFPLYDVHLAVREGTAMLRNTLTLIDGRPLPPLPPAPPAPWIETSPEQRALGDAVRAATAAALASLRDPEHFGTRRPPEPPGLHA